MCTHCMPRTLRGSSVPLENPLATTFGPSSVAPALRRREFWLLFKHVTTIYNWIHECSPFFLRLVSFPQSTKIWETSGQPKATGQLPDSWGHLGQEGDCQRPQGLTSNREAFHRCEMQWNPSATFAGSILLAVPKDIVYLLFVWDLLWIHTGGPSEPIGPRAFEHGNQRRPGRGSTLGALPGFFRLSFDGSASEREAGGFGEPEFGPRAPGLWISWYQCDTVTGPEVACLGWNFGNWIGPTATAFQAWQIILLEFDTCTLLHTFVLIVLGCKGRTWHQLTSIDINFLVSKTMAGLPLDAVVAYLRSGPPAFLLVLVARAWVCSPLNFHQLPGARMGPEQTVRVLFSVIWTSRSSLTFWQFSSFQPFPIHFRSEVKVAPFPMSCKSFCPWPSPRAATPGGGKWKTHWRLVGNGGMMVDGYRSFPHSLPSTSEKRDHCNQFQSMIERDVSHKRWYCLQVRLETPFLDSGVLLGYIIRLSAWNHRSSRPTFPSSFYCFVSF